MDDPSEKSPASFMAKTSEDEVKLLELTRLNGEWTSTAAKRPRRKNLEHLVAVEEEILALELPQEMRMVHDPESYFRMVKCRARREARGFVSQHLG